MKQFDVVESFVAQCESAASLDDLRCAFQQAIHQLGFRYFACGSHVDPLHPREAVMLLNYPKAWVKAYSELQLHSIDPVFLRANETGVPFRWDDEHFRRGISTTQRRMLQEAKRFGIENGFTVPIHSPLVRPLIRASCSVVPDSRRGLGAYNYFAAQLMACYLFEAAAKLTGLSSADAPCPALSTQQRKCLEHVAQGKTDWEISRLMTLSESTVHNYIESVKRRLRVATRTQAVVLALASHQISFGDVVRARTNQRSAPGKR